MEMFSHLHGTKVKGSVIKDIAEKNNLFFVIITNKELMTYDFKLTIGKNTSSKEIIFTTNDEIETFYNHGDGYHRLSFDDDEETFVLINTFTAKNITISEKVLFNKKTEIISTIPSMYFTLADNEIYDPDIIGAYFCSNTNKDRWYLYKHCKYTNNAALAGMTHRELRHVFKTLKNNKEFALEMLAFDGMELEFFSEKIKADKECVLIAVTNNGMAVRYSVQSLRNDPAIRFAAIKSHPESLCYMGRCPPHNPHHSWRSAHEERK